MEFYTVFSEPRPIRLSDETRKFAEESLHGKYGDEAMATPYIVLDNISGFASLSAQDQYNTAIIQIAENAPLRVCGHECVSGSATLGEAIHHVIPAFYKGKPVFHSVSHLTVDFFTVVFQGVNALEDRIQRRRKEHINNKEKEALEGMQNVVDALRIYHKRYMNRLKDSMPEIESLLQNVPFQPAKCFKEAVQSIWFVFSFLRLCGNWPGIGRIDELLGGFLKKDLREGILTLDEAREFLAGMFIKGCEWIQSNTPCGSGDAQHYQNIVLGGIDQNGCEVTNEVTYLVLDIIEELAISDFPITVRINENSPERLVTRVAEVMRHGGGIIAVYNEPLILKSLVGFGYSETDARLFANDGCWEVQIPGCTRFNYVPFDALSILLNDTLKLHTDTPACFDSFDVLYQEFKKHLTDKIKDIIQERLGDNEFGVLNAKWKYPANMPCSVVSLFEDGCIENARSYLDDGTKYAVVSPHIGGAPDVGNSLYAIDKLVFQERKVSFSEFMRILRNNWEGSESLRQYVSNKYIYYGNDDDEADRYTVAVIDDFAKIVSNFDIGYPIRFPAGVSTFGRQIDWRDNRCATPFGRKRGDILSGNASPTPDTDFEGATAVIRSYCKADNVKLTCGSALDIKLLPSAVEGKNGLTALKSLIRGFVRLGGFFMQLDVMDWKILEEARKHPKQHKTLSVRVSGWNARFVTLNDEWQQMIMERTAQRM